MWNAKTYWIFLGIMHKGCPLGSQCSRQVHASPVFRGITVRLRGRDACLMSIGGRANNGTTAQKCKQQALQEMGRVCLCKEFRGSFERADGVLLAGHLDRLNSRRSVRTSPFLQGTSEFPFGMVECPPASEICDPLGAQVKSRTHPFHLCGLQSPT